ncbi:MAG TPA: VWA domain-containing protein [Pseudonocardiaceae bacterium]
MLIGVLATTTVVLTQRPIQGHPMAMGSDLAGVACTERSALTVVAPPVLEPLVRAAAERRCVTLDLRSAGGREGVVASLDKADVWVTDSRLWVMARGRLDPASGVSVASSPIVMLAGPGVMQAARLSAPGASWGLVLKRAQVPGLRLGIQDPAGTAVGLLAGQGVFATAKAALPDDFTALSATAAGLQQPRLLDAVTLGPVDPAELVFAAEYAAHTASGATVLRGAEGEPALDFPAYALTTDPARAAAATALVEALRAPELATVRARSMLREPGGEASFPAAVAPLGPRMPLADPATALRLFGLAQSGSVPGRNLVTVDVSGSMAAQQANGETLMDVVRRSGLVALTALSDRSSMGLWEFASRLDGERDHRELVPITPLGQGRAATMQAVRDLAVVPDGATGLYDTVFAAYQRLQRDYDPAAQQYLVVLTDGKNENDSGLDLDGLLSSIRDVQDPARPISLIAIGYGKADTALLQRIADVMGGSVYSVSAAEQIVGVLIDAIGRAHTS